MIADYMLVGNQHIMKVKFLYISDQAFYITKNGDITRCFLYQKINSVIVAGFSGEVALLLDSQEAIIIDTVENQSRLVQMLSKFCKKETPMAYVNSTCLKKHLNVKKDSSGKRLFGEEISRLEENWRLDPVGGDYGG